MFFYFYSQSIHLLSTDEGTGFTYHTYANIFWWVKAIFNGETENTNFTLEVLFIFPSNTPLTLFYCVAVPSFKFFKDVKKIAQNLINLLFIETTLKTFNFLNFVIFRIFRW